MKKIISILVISGVFASFINNASAGYFPYDAKRACPQMITSFLTSGNASDEVLFMQNELKKEGYYKGNPDGNFDNSTMVALQQFQRDNNLLQSGKIGQYTMDSLNQRICGFSNYNFNSNSNSNVSPYNTGTTFVDAFDPFVRVITAESDKYVASQNSTQPVSYSNVNSLPTVNGLNVSGTSIVNINSANISVIPPATLINQSVTSANLIYNPSIGYTYSVSPNSGSITVLSPGVNSVFREGDNVKISWRASNLNVSVYQVLLENTITGRSKEITTTSGNEVSVTLTKDLLDYVCYSTCDSYQQGSFQIAVATPIKDMVGNVTNLKARVYPLTIKRDIFSQSVANISASKSPASSNETFKIYINISNPSLFWNQTNNKYSFGVSASCSSGVSVSIGGMNCGQELSMPQTSQYTQREVPVTAINNGWFTQPVTFNLSVYDEFGRITGTSSTTVQINPTPKSI